MEHYRDGCPPGDTLRKTPCTDPGCSGSVDRKYQGLRLSKWAPESQAEGKGEYSLLSQSLHLRRNNGRGSGSPTAALPRDLDSESVCSSVSLSKIELQNLSHSHGFQITPALGPKPHEASRIKSMSPVVFQLHPPAPDQPSKLTCPL